MNNNSKAKAAAPGSKKDRPRSSVRSSKAKARLLDKMSPASRVRFEVGFQTTIKRIFSRKSIKRFNHQKASGGAVRLNGVAGVQIQVVPPQSADKNKKRREGTPEKATTPGPEDDGSTDGRQQVLNDEEIQSLAIKQEELERIRQEAVGNAVKQGSKGTKGFLVKVNNKLTEPKKPNKTVKVARGAPPRAPLKPFDSEGRSGPRFDQHGNVISHSLLGTLEEFKSQAEKNGELKVDYYIRDQDRVQTPGIKSVHKETVSKHPVVESEQESNALLNWQKKIRERKLQQGYISNLLQKPVEHLVMNQGDTYRAKQELRYLIDRSIPAVDYGKGYRIGSEFWNQQTVIGDDTTGIHMTLGQTDRGYPPPVEHVGVPLAVQYEKGACPASRPSSALNKPWHTSKFLKERIDELRTVMTDLDPHQPDLDNLQIIDIEQQGHAQTAEEEENIDPLAMHPDVYEVPIFGPCIKFNGQLLQWTGDSTSNRNKVAADARVTFEASAGHRVSCNLVIENYGTTAIYYNWKMLPKSNPFDLVNANVQRFYFNTSKGVILPGDKLEFPFVFKSDKAGVYKEQWEFQTHPAVAGGASLLVTLKGVAIREDKYKKQREQLESKLQSNIVWNNMRRIVDDIVASIREPERPRSPVDSYLTEEQMFLRQNPHLQYKHEVVQQMKDLHRMLDQPMRTDADEDGNATEPAGIQDFEPWNLNIAEFKRKVLELDEDDERRAAYLERINESVMQLAFHHLSPRLRRMYQTCYQQLGVEVDKMCEQSIYLRQLLGLPEKEMEEPVEETARSDCSSAVSINLTTSRSANKSYDSRAVAKPSETKGGKVPAGKATPKGGAKEEKKSGKSDGKKDAKQKEPPAKKGDRASPTKKTPPTKAAASSSNMLVAAAPDGRATPGDPLMSPTPQKQVDPVVERKYQEKLSTQVYTDLNDFILRIVDAFEQVNEEMMNAM